MHASDRPANLTVIGLGLIGGSISLALREAGFVTRITGVDASPEHCTQALALNLVDRIAPFEESLCDADLVILAVPVNAILELLPRVLDLIPEQATVTDMGSTKKTICDAVAGHRNRLQFVPSHPMAGTENSGPASAFKTLFTGKTAVICECEEAGARHLARVQALYAALGMHTIYLSAPAHDRHAAYVSHLSHISSFALAATVLDKEKDEGRIFDLAGGGFESTVRLAKSSPEMWNPIFEQNQANVAQALGDYIAQLQTFHRSLLARQWEKTRDQMNAANRIRKVLNRIGAQGAKKV